LSPEQPPDQRTYGIGDASRIAVTWDTDASRLISPPVRMTSHNAVNQLGTQMVQDPRHAPWVGTREVMTVMLQVSYEELAACRNVAPAFIAPSMAVPSPLVAMGRARDPRGRGEAVGKGHGEGACWRTVGRLPWGTPMLPWRLLPRFATPGDSVAAVQAALARLERTVSALTTPVRYDAG
jgi:hypothetical protein